MLHSASTSKRICQTTCIVKVKAASLPDAVQEADPMAILEQLMKKGQPKPEKTPKNEKTSKQLLGEFYGDKKHLESLLKDKGTVSLGLRPCGLCADCDSPPPHWASPIFTLEQIWHRGRREVGSHWRMSSRTASETSTRAPSSGARRNPLARPRERPRTGWRKMTSLLRTPPPNRTSVCWRAWRKLTRVRKASAPTCCSVFFYLWKEKKHTAWHEHVRTDLASGNTEVCIKKADEVMKMILGCSERDMPNKKVLLGKLHSCIGNAYLEIGDIDKALEHHQKDLELAMQWWVIEEM